MQWQLFANLAETAGERRVTVNLESGSTVEDAVETLLEKHPSLAAEVRADDGGIQDHLTVLRNGEAVADGLDVAVDQDDELALMPPVSGG